MSLFDRLRAGMGVQRPLPAQDEPSSSADEQAVARYRYLLRTAPPETIEAAHAEAFAQLTPDQRRRVLEELAASAPAAERDAVLRGDPSPQWLARAATRAELRQPGTLERTFGSAGIGAAGGAVPGGAMPGLGAPGLGGLFAGGFLSSMAGTVLGSMIAQQFMSHHASASGLFDASAADPSGHAAIPDGYLGADAARDVNAGLDGSGESLDDGAGAADGALDAFDSDDNYGGFDSGDTFDV